VIIVLELVLITEKDMLYYRDVFSQIAAVLHVSKIIK